MFLVARFLAPIIYVAPPASSYTYWPSLPLPSLSTALGALIARLNELEPKDGDIFPKRIKKGRRNIVDIESSVAWKRLIDLSNHKFALGVTPIEGLLYGVQRTGIIRRINRYAKDEEDNPDALAHEYSIVYAFEIAVGIDESYSDLVKKALMSITRIGDSESLVTAIAIEEVERTNSVEALGVLPVDRIDNCTDVILYRGSLFPNTATYSSKTKSELLKIRHLAFSLEPDSKLKALRPRTLKIKPNLVGKKVLVARPERPIALVNYSALMEVKKA